jgi:hypothetical protein
MRGPHWEPDCSQGWPLRYGLPPPMRRSCPAHRQWVWPPRRRPESARARAVRWRGQTRPASKGCYQKKRRRGDRSSGEVSPQSAPPWWPMRADTLHPAPAGSGQEPTIVKRPRPRSVGYQSAARHARAPEDGRPCPGRRSHDAWVQTGTRPSGGPGPAGRVVAARRRPTRAQSARARGRDARVARARGRYARGRGRRTRSGYTPWARGWQSTDCR